ncbi:hypothetical protein GLYMA_10G293300v4 [Glycine max]|uniref:Uncharacterized protein n=1 Tax=Glycine max TaxID=3847 RepID=A0A0R0I5F8_SOYBN|nr:hypothetical protein JHK85_030205 [Glycine max]KAG5153339.1 hypothetical protein JHK84_029811 [Glycine max]KRH36258.1 hypothetical protein GLYMA_10G293300v4 [Glycine max]
MERIMKVIGEFASCIPKSPVSHSLQFAATQRTFLVSLKCAKAKECSISWSKIVLLSWPFSYTDTAVLTRETPRPKSACVPSEKYSETSERSTQVTQPSWYASQLQ